MKAFLGRGALAGAAGGIAAALFQWIVTEDQIRVALEIEAANSTEGGEEMFTRTTQVVGGMIAAGLYGLFLGVTFGFACAILWRTLPGRTAFSRSIRLATVAFVAWVLVPQLKYPANPPAVGDADTVGQRTASYVGLLAASLILAYMAWSLWRMLGERGDGGAKRFSIVAGGYLAVIALFYVILPANPDPLEVPANLIWHFRIDSLAGNALMWLVMGTVFGFLGDYSRRKDGQPLQVDEPVSA